MVEQYQIECRCRRGDRRTTIYEAVPFKRVADVSRIWTPEYSGDDFPLVLLKADLPQLGDTDMRAVDLHYRLPSLKSEGFCFWSASRPIYLEKLTLNASRLSGARRFKFERFLPNFDRAGTHDIVTNDVFAVKVENWVLKGHGVMLTWH